MTNEQKLREFATKQFPLSKELKKEVLYNSIQQAKQDECLSDLTALISEHYYPKEFLLWTHSQGYWLFDSLTCLWVSDEPKAFQEEKTTDELFNYWKENEQ